MPFSFRFRTLVAAMAACAAGCSSPRSTVNYIVTTDSHYICCRTVRYATGEFSHVTASTMAGEGVVVRLGRDSTAGRCSADVEIPLTVANNGERDVYIPISNELSGERIKLYPWRWVTVEGRRVRLARQIQYGDLVESMEAHLRFFRLPAGKEIHLEGVIPSSWLCTLPLAPYDGYLAAELDPKVLADYTRLVRARKQPDDSLSLGEWGLQYDVVYTPLDFIDALPVRQKQWNEARDTVTVQLGVPEEPATFINNSQKVAHSNVITLVVAR